jgi:hypothetical protein
MITVSFTYSEIDAAGQPSSPANASITFSLALPVTLTSFTGTASQCNVTLDWTTTNAVNFGYFELEYSSDGTNYSAIGKIMGIPGSGPKAYSFVYGGQSTPIGYYRLKMVDLDGSFTYSNVVLVRSLCIGNLATVLPNPVRDVVTINGLAGNEAIKIYDASGRLILVRQVANTQERINMSSFSGGIYQLIIISGNNKQMQVVKLVKQ